MTRTPSTPSTAAGRAMLERLLRPWSSRENIDGLSDILAIEAEARAPLDVVRAILDEPCPFCHDASTIGCPESSHAIRSRLRAALEEPTPFVHPRLGVFAPNGPNPNPLEEPTDD